MPSLGPTCDFYPLCFTTAHQKVSFLHYPSFFTPTTCARSSLLHSRPCHPHRHPRAASARYPPHVLCWARARSLPPHARCSACVVDIRHAPWPSSLSPELPPHQYYASGMPKVMHLLGTGPNFIESVFLCKIRAL